MAEIFIPPVLLAKRAMRSLLADTAEVTTSTGTYTIQLCNQVTWIGHIESPADHPDALPGPIPTDQLTLIGEVLCDASIPDGQPHMFTQEPCEFAVVVNATVGKDSALTADDYLDIVSAEVQSIVMAHGTAAERTLGGTVRNVIYKGTEKRDVGMSTAIRILIVKFEALVRYPADSPVSSSISQPV